jgi:FMN phosphatase YigB (HAD superfamily)
MIRGHPQTGHVDRVHVALEPQTGMINDRDAVTKEQRKLDESLLATSGANERASDGIDRAITAHAPMIDDRDEIIGVQQERLARLEAELARAHRAIDELEAVTSRQERYIAQRIPELAETSPSTGELTSPGPRPSAFRSFAARELRRQHAIARAVAPHLPPRVMQAGVKAKRAVSRSRWWCRLQGRPAPLVPAVESSALSLVFDEEFYTAHYGRPADMSPLRHYLLHGWFRGHDPSPFFSVNWYLGQHPEVAASGQEPLSHYLESGYRSGYNPQPWFDGVWYAAENPGLDLSRMSPLEHYLTEGLAAGKSVSEAHFRLLAGSRTRAGGSELQPMTAIVLTGGTESGPIPFSSIPSQGFDLVTLDLWDTLICRDRPADAAKVATARRMVIRLGPRTDAGVWELFRRRVDTEAKLASSAEDEEYELANVLAHVLADLGIEGEEAIELAEQLADAELEDEIASTRVVPEVTAFVHRLLNQPSPPAVAVLSDFYMGSERLEKLLKAHALDLPVLSSCEIGGSKRMCTSFAIARERLGRVDGQHLHIGDHPFSDGRHAVACGATAVVIDRHHLPDLPGPGHLDSSYYDGLLDRLASDLRELGLATAPHELERPLEREAFLAGVASATLPVALVAGAIELAAAHRADRIFYMSREGAFLSRLHRAIGPMLADGASPSPIHLEVSRRSTFGASIARVYEDCVARLWRQYPDQSLRGFLISLNLEPERFAGTAIKMGVDLDEVIPDIKAHLPFREFLDRSEVHAAMTESFRDQRAKLDAYLDARGFDGETVVVVDIGWRGTIQDNLCYLRPDTIISGAYLGLFPYLHPQPVNARKWGVVFDGNHGEEYGYVSPPGAVESPWTGRVPTALGYVWAADGVATAVGELEEGRADNLISEYQRGVQAAASLVAERLVANGAVTSLLRRALQNRLRAWYERPDPGVADIWFSSLHDDTFGALNVTPFGKPLPSMRFAYESRPVQESGEALASLWPPGYEQWRPVRALNAIRTLRSS